jgi:hypothetical protein
MTLFILTSIFISLSLPLFLLTFFFCLHLFVSSFYLFSYFFTPISSPLFLYASLPLFLLCIELCIVLVLHTLLHSLQVIMFFNL